MKQLKKLDFLNSVPEEFTSLDVLAQSLQKDGFEFVPSFVPFLKEHFVAQGKIEADEQGNIRRKAKKGAIVHTLFRVVKNDEGKFVVEQKENTGILSVEDKEAGWSATRKAAVKKVNSAVFAEYRAQADELKALIEG